MLATVPLSFVSTVRSCSLRRFGSTQSASVCSTILDAQNGLVSDTRARSVLILLTLRKLPRDLKTHILSSLCSKIKKATSALQCVTNSLIFVSTVSMRCLYYFFRQPAGLRFLLGMFASVGCYSWYSIVKIVQTEQIDSRDSQIRKTELHTYVLRSGKSPAERPILEHYAENSDPGSQNLSCRDIEAVYARCIYTLVCIYTCNLHLFIARVCLFSLSTLPARFVRSALALLA